MPEQNASIRIMKGVFMDLKKGIFVDIQIPIS